MASLYITTGGARTAPLDLLLSTIPSLPRPLLARLTERLVERLDQLDGDADDNNANGDEDDGSNAEDDWWPHSNWRGEPGCPIADPDMGADDEGEATDEREPEDYDGGGVIEPRHIPPWANTQ